MSFFKKITQTTFSVGARPGGEKFDAVQKAMESAGEALAKVNDELAASVIGVDTGGPDESVILTGDAVIKVQGKKVTINGDVELVKVNGKAVFTASP